MVGGIVFSLLCGVFAILLWSTRPAAADARGLGTFLLLRSAIPPLLLGWCLLLGWLSSPLINTVRLKLTSLEVGLGRPAGAATTAALFRVGNSVRPDDAVKSGWPEPDLVAATGVNAPVGEQRDYVAVRQRDAQTITAQLHSRAKADDLVLVSYEPETYEPEKGDRRTFVGATPLSDKSKLCFARCSTGGTEYTFEAGRLVLPSGKSIALNTRSGLAGWAKPWGPDAAVYPVRSLKGAGLNGSRSVLFEDVDAKQWYAFLVDPGATASGGDAAKGAASGEIVIGTGVSLPSGTQSSMRIRIGQIDLARPRGACPRGDDAGSCGNSRLRERRSFVLSVAAPAAPGMSAAAVLTPDTSEIVPLGKASLPRTRLVSTSDPDDPAAFSLSSILGASRPDSLLNAAANNFSATFRAYQDGSEDPFAPASKRRFCRPNPNQVCAGDGARAVRFTIDEMRLPWLLLVIAAAVAFVIHAGFGSNWLRDPADGVLLAVLQFLLCLRTIFAVEGTVVDIDLAWQTLYGECAIALVALPTVLVALRSSEESRLPALCALLFFNLSAYSAAWHWLGRFDSNQEVLVELAIGAVLLRIVTLLIPAGIFGKLAGASTRLISKWAIPLLLLLVAARALLALAGIKERIGGFAISIVYLPPLLVLLGAILAAADREPTTRLWRGFAFAALVAAALSVPWLARDSGFAFVYFWPIFGFAMWRALVWWREQPKPSMLTMLPWMAPLPAVGIGGAALLALLGVTYWNPPTLDPDDRKSIAARLDFAERLKDSNMVRFVAVAAPNAVPQIGTLAASQQMAQTVHLVERTRTLFGDGYMLPSNLPTRQVANFGVLHDVHLTDNVSAVHLMSPFGRVSALMLLLTLAAAAISLCADRAREAWTHWPTVAGALSVWTLFGAAAYMILANLQLVPFTGRNIYLLAPSSGADLLEGLFLFALAAIGLRRESAA